MTMDVPAEWAQDLDEELGPADVVLAADSYAPPQYDHGYDPKGCGANCDECPLRGSTPVPPEINNGALATVVGDTPNQNDERIGVPFSARTGEELATALKPLHLQRPDFSYINTLACRPPMGKLNRTLARVKKANRETQKKNKERAKHGMRLLPLQKTPMECCHPRLIHDLTEATKAQRDPTTVRMLAMGPLALKWALGVKAKHGAVAGGMLDGNLYGDVDEKTKQQRLKFLQPDRPGDVLPPGGVPCQSIATWHPAFVASKRRYTKAFRAHIRRVVMWYRGEPGFRDPDILWHPKADELRAFLFNNPRPLTFDIETDRGKVPGYPQMDVPFFEPMWVGINCIGIGDNKTVALIGFKSKYKDGHGNDLCPWYTPAELAAVKHVLREYFADKRYTKIGHNAGVFDRIVTYCNLGVDVAGSQLPGDTPLHDTLILHKGAESELPHNLGFVAGVYAPALKAWKADREGKKKATEAESDRELGVYCAQDVALTHTVYPTLLNEVIMRGQDRVVQVDHTIQRICGEMKALGFYVDQDRRKKAEEQCVRDLLKWRGVCRKLSGRPDFNPGSIYQWREVLFDEWKLRPNVESETSVLRNDDDWHTDAGDPRTSDMVFRELLKLPTLQKHQRDLIRAGRRFRKHQKELGTYIAKLRPITDTLGWLGQIGRDEADYADEEAREEAEYRKAKKLPRRGIVWPDGRFRPGYNVLPVTGRLNSSRPMNAQNFPKHLRTLVRAAPGHIFVAADADQLELRIAAARWNIQKYLQAFANGHDPHGSVTALAIFGDLFIKAAGCPPPWPSGFAYPKAAKGMRDLAKRVQYGGQYGAEIPTLTRVIQEAEDRKTGELIYLLKTQPEIRALYNDWLSGVPEYKIGWEREQIEFRRRGFTFEPIHGRRRDCADGPEANKIINFPVQSSAAALINEAMIKIVGEIPMNKWGPNTGLVTQTHDELVVEAPIDGCYHNGKEWVMPPGTPARYAADVIEWAMNVTHPSIPGVAITGAAEASLVWSMDGSIAA